MLVRFVESEAAVVDQVDRLRRLSDGSNCKLSMADGADEDLWSQVADFDASCEVTLKASVAVSKITRGLEICEKRFPDSVASADMGMGLVRMGIGNGDLDLIAGIKHVRAEIESIGGSLVIERAPSLIRLQADAWGDAGPAIKIMRAIKQSFDPYSLLSPGRFVRGGEE
jgi:glycolate oxidase FAD binding subunit